MSKEKQRFKSDIQKLLAQLNKLGKRRHDLAESFLAGREITAEMYDQLERGQYPDKLFQSKWREFQGLQKEIKELKDKGADIILRRMEVSPVYRDKMMGKYFGK